MKTHEHLWNPLAAWRHGGMADGNTYVGNVDLNPELVHEIELGLD